MDMRASGTTQEDEMARGRMINRKIACNPELARVSDHSALLFTWMIPFADRDGRCHGNPDVIKGQIMVRRKSFSVELIEECLTELAELGLIVWYKDERDSYVSFPGFHKNQEGMRYDREAVSHLPPPPTEADSSTEYIVRGPTPEPLRSNSGPAPGEWNGREVNGREVNGKEAKLERETLQVLQSIHNWPFNYSKDLSYTRDLSVEFPQVDLLAEVKRLAAWYLDNPMKSNANPRLRLRNWCENAVKFGRYSEPTTKRERKKASDLNREEA